jgi:enoyl-CoA hydratase
MREYDALDVSLENDVFRIAFDDPQNQNAVGPEAHNELTHVFEDARSESEARVVLLTGNGQVFSAGGDLDRMKSRIENPKEDPFLESLQEAQSIVQDFISLEKPVVAKVNGHAIGLGATLALLADLTYMSTDGRIGDPHVQAGLVAGDGGAIIWPLLTDLHTAKEFLMTGKVADAEEAAEMGLVNAAISPSELDEHVDEVINDLATGPQKAIQYTKTALNGWLRMGVSNILQESLAYEAISQRDPDHAAAVEALLDGREPTFPSGRDNND